jgi:phenylalanyl-tRNA synthetase beta chain
LPVIHVMKYDLERLIGRVLKREDILDLLPRIKCEVEYVSDEGEIEYEVTHDRPDLYSAEGLAMALRGLLGLEMYRYKFVDEGVKAYNMGVPRRPYVAFAIVKDVELDDEAVKQIMQLQEKLATTCGRGRRKASIGVYDLDKITPPIYYELRDPDNTFLKPLNTEEVMSLREILDKTEKGRLYGYLIRDWDKYPVLRDSENKILSLPPIINGDDTKVTIDTRNILIDSTGIDQKTVIDMVTVMATSIAERSSSGIIVFVDTIMPDNNVIKAPRSEGVKINFKISMAEEVIGVRINRDRITELLKRMGYLNISVKDNDVVEVTTPPYRLDIHSWIDVVEDIAMSIGYEVIGSKALELPPATHPGKPHPLEYLSRIIRGIISSYGFVEIANYMMSNPRIQLEVFGITNQDIIMVSNPKMDKYTGLRKWLTPGLLEFILENKDRYNNIRIYEIGDVAIPDPETETGARIERRVGIAIYYRKATLTDGLAIISALMNRFGLKSVFVKDRINGMLPERTARIMVNDENIGFVAEIHPTILYKLGIEYPVVVSEIILNKLLLLLKK